MTPIWFCMFISVLNFHLEYNHNTTQCLIKFLVRKFMRVHSMKYLQTLCVMKTTLLLLEDMNNQQTHICQQSNRQKNQHLENEWLRVIVEHDKSNGMGTVMFNYFSHIWCRFIIKLTWQKMIYLMFECLVLSQVDIWHTCNLKLIKFILRGQIIHLLAWNFPKMWTST